MVAQSALKELAMAIACSGVLLTSPLHGIAAEPSRAIAVQPPAAIKAIQSPAVVKAPPVALPKPALPPAMARPILVQPVPPGPINVRPIKTVKPEVSLTPISPKPPLTPIGNGDPPHGPGVDSSITATLMEYQKDVSKETRAERKLARDSKALANSARAEKLKLDNESINHGMDESREKADQLTDGAQVEMGLGVVSGAQQIGAGTGSVGGKNGKGTKVEKIEVPQHRAKRDVLRDSKGKEPDSGKDALEDKIGKTDAQQGRLKNQTGKLDKTGNKMEELQPQFTDAHTGDIESLVQQVMAETDRGNKADLRQQLKEVKDANAKKKALRDAAAKDSDRTQRKDGGNGGKTAAASPLTAVSTATPKTSLISRPCTPINPC